MLALLALRPLQVPLRHPLVYSRHLRVCLPHLQVCLPHRRACLHHLPLHCHRAYPPHHRAFLRHQACRHHLRSRRCRPLLLPFRRRSLRSKQRSHHHLLVCHRLACRIAHLLRHTRVCLHHLACPPHLRRQAFLLHPHHRAYH